eukprot:GAHX01005576.1.p3 GENE.GAHX01005576.1~~GAHX01005576.1.p3  ORF type:complete len:66 (-),score=5.01 GAHX01005576.1:239-436(-)
MKVIWVIISPPVLMQSLTTETNSLVPQPSAIPTTSSKSHCMYIIRFKASKRSQSHPFRMVTTIIT